MMPDRPTNRQAVRVAGNGKRLVFIRIISTIVLSSGFIARKKAIFVSPFQRDPAWPGGTNDCTPFSTSKGQQFGGNDPGGNSSTRFRLSSGQQYGK
jgi:hypothetical protein